MPNIGPMELVIVLVIALLIVGPKKLPEMGRSVGRSMREFKGSLAGNDDNEGKRGEIERHESPADATVTTTATTVPNETAAHGG